MMGFAVVCGGPQGVSADINQIIGRSAKVTHEDWLRSPDFDFCEMDRGTSDTRAYQVSMIAGAPYSHLVAMNGQPLRGDVEENAAGKKAAVIQQQQETDEQRSKRVAQYQKVRQRDQLLLEQLTEGMVFTMTGTATVDGHTTYVLAAKPRPGYVATDVRTKLLAAMRGTLWIDQASLRWVRVEAEVIHPVMIDGFLALVEPGTKFELEEMPIGDTGVWLPSHFSMQSRALIFLLFPKTSRQDETYFHYKVNGALTAESCLQP
jgi:hypothetical protein